MPMLTAEDLEASLSKNSIYTGALAQYLNRLNFKDGSEVGGHIDSELRTILQEREDVLSSKPSTVVSANISTEQKTRLEELFPELRLKFVGSSFCDHPFANAMRACINSLFYNQMRGSKIVDVGGSYAYHVANRHKDVHVCNPILTGKDVLRRKIEVQNIKSMRADEKNCGDIAFTTSMETCQYCLNTFKDCPVEGDCALIVDVYDMSLQYIVDSMDKRGITRLMLALMLPVELLEPQGEVTLRDTDTVVSWRRNLIFRDKVNYFVNNVGDVYTHNLKDLRAFLTTGSLLSSNQVNYHVILDSVRGDYKLFSIVRVSNDLPVHSKTRRIPTTLSGTYHLKVPKDFQNSYETRSVYLDTEFIGRVKSYLVNTTNQVSERNFEYAMSCLRSQKTHLIVGSRVIHSKVEIDPNLLPIIVATMLRDSVNSRAIALEVANLSSNEVWNIFQWVWFAIKALWRWICKQFRRLMMFIVKLVASKYYKFLMDIKHPLTPVNETVDVPLTTSFIPCFLDPDNYDHEREFRANVEAEKVRALEKQKEILKRLLSEAISNKVDADEFVGKLLDAEIRPDSLGDLWKQIEKERKAATKEKISQTASDDLLKDSALRDKVLEERMMSDDFKLDDLKLFEGYSNPGESSGTKLEGLSDGQARVVEDLLSVDDDARKVKGKSVVTDDDGKGEKKFLKSKRLLDTSVEKLLPIKEEVGKKNQSEDFSFDECCIVDDFLSSLDADESPHSRLPSSNVGGVKDSSSGDLGIVSTATLPDTDVGVSSFFEEFERAAIEMEAEELKGGRSGPPPGKISPATSEGREKREGVIARNFCGHSASSPLKSPPVVTDDHKNVIKPFLEDVCNSSASDAGSEDCASTSSEKSDTDVGGPDMVYGQVVGGRGKVEEAMLEELLDDSSGASTLDMFKRCLPRGCDWVVAGDPSTSIHRGSFCPARSVPSEFAGKACVEYMLHNAAMCFDLFSKYLKLRGQVGRLNSKGDVSNETKSSFRSLNVFRRHADYVYIDKEKVSPGTAFRIFDVSEERFVTPADVRNAVDPQKWYAVCDDLFKGIPFRLLAATVKLASTMDVDAKFATLNVGLENTPPGGGKTTRLVDEYLKFPHQTLVVTANSGSAEDINQEVARRLKKPKKRVARTADSRVMNWVATTRVAVCRIDECFLLHYGQLKFVAVLSRADNIVLYGDENQIPFINRLAGFRCKVEALRADNVKCLQIDGTYRCPSDVCVHLSCLKKDDGKLCYPKGVKKLNDSRPERSVSKLPILSVDEVPSEGFDVYLTFTQDEKNQMRSSLVRRRSKARVMTVHECQGKTFSNVAVVRTKPADDIVFDSLGHHIVAVSRHTVSLKYFVISKKLNDRLGKSVGAMQSVSDEVLRGVDFKQCS
nr:hypothetical protein [Lingue ampelovirus 1]